MAFLGRWPDGFVPEEHGWVRSELARPDMLVWLRWEIPYRFPASIAECLHDEASGAVGGFYDGPVKGEFVQEARTGDIWAEMQRTDLNELNTVRVG